MKKFIKSGTVLSVLIFVLCLIGCDFIDNKNKENPSKNIPEELNRDNAREVLGDDYKTKTSIVIPNGVKKIKANVFGGSSTLKTITIPESVTYIDDPLSNYNGVFANCTALQSIVLPSSLTYLGSCAFKDCTALEYVTIPEGITNIGKYAFAGCISLKSISFPASIGSINENMCDGCLSLTSVTIPEGINEIGEEALKNCKVLSSIILPSSVLRIYDYAFYNCTALDSVTIKAEIPPTLIRYGFPNTFTNNKSGRKIYVPANSVETYKTASVWGFYADDIEAM